MYNDSTQFVFNCFIVNKLEWTCVWIMVYIVVVLYTNKHEWKPMTTRYHARYIPHSPHYDGDMKYVFSTNEFDELIYWQNINKEIDSLVFGEKTRQIIGKNGGVEWWAQPFVIQAGNRSLWFGTREYWLNICDN